MRLSRIALTLFATPFLATPSHAQHWDGPLFSSPFEPSSRFEILASDASGAGAGGAIAVRPFASAPDLRIRAGIMDGLGTGVFDEPDFASTWRQPVAYMAGVDYSIPIAPRSTGPVRAALVAGLGVGVNHGTRVSAPVGITVGYDGGWIRPYMTPRLSLEHAHRVHVNGGVAVRGVIDWGVDVDLPLGGTLRAALTTGDYRGGGIGISF